MASSTPLCDICNLRHTSNPATVWCSECDEGFCTDCSEHHHLAKSTRHHITTQIDNYQKLPEYVLDIEQSCKTHEEQFTHFCKQHNSPCCVTCILQNHKQCQDISKIVDVVKNVKSSYTFQDTEQVLTELAKHIKKIQKDRRENLMSLQNSKIQVEKEIKEFRVKVNNHLDKLQDDIIKELNEAEENEKKKIQNMVDDLAQKEKEIKQLQVNLSNIKQQHASDLQAYLAMRQIQTDVSKTETSVESLVNNNLKLKVLSIKMNATMKDFLSSAKTFGNIIMEDKGCTVVPSKKKNPQAQSLVPHRHRNIDDISLQLQQRLYVNNSSIKGCCTLPDDRLVFTSYYDNKLIFMNAGGTLITTLTIPNAFDVIYVKYNNTLAVSSGNVSMCIRFINIKTYKVEQTIKLKTDCYGIAVKNNTLFYCSEEGLYSISLMDKSITKVKNFIQLSHSYIDIYDNNLYHTKRATNTVTCSDLSGEMKWEFKDEKILRSPEGISVDNQGNVYVAGDKISNVVVISPNGQKCRELLSNKDKLNKPTAIHYDRSTNNLLVVNWNDNQAFLYKVT